jgi:hypothetical protein
MIDYCHISMCFTVSAGKIWWGMWLPYGFIRIPLLNTRWWGYTTHLSDTLSLTLSLSHSLTHSLCQARSSVDGVDGVCLLCCCSDLDRARTWGLVTGTDLHAMFLVTPTWDLDRIEPKWRK